MKRKHIEYERRKYWSYTIKPWFIWRMCTMCKYDFRRELIHVIEMKWMRKRAGGCEIFSSHGNDRFHFCTSCMPTLEQAKKMV